MAQPLFRMLQLNDVHLHAGRDPDLTRPLFDKVIEGWLSGRFGPAPDLILGVGDLADHPRGEDSACAAEALARLAAARPVEPATILTLPGNHEVGINDDPVDAEAYRAAFGPERLTYAWLYRGIMVIMINNAAADAEWNDALDARQAFLAELFARYPDVPKLIACHTPLIEMRDAAALEGSFAFYSWINQDAQRRLQHLIERYRDSVIAVVSGHLHLTARVERAGVHYIVTSGPFSWPGDTGIYEFYPDRVEVRMIGLPEPERLGWLADYPLGNGIHDRHEGREFTDALHPTFRDYIRGNPDERAFTLPMPRPPAPEFADANRLLAALPA